MYLFRIQHMVGKVNKDKLIICNGKVILPNRKVEYVGGNDRGGGGWKLDAVHAGYLCKHFTPSDIWQKSF